MKPDNERKFWVTHRPFRQSRTKQLNDIIIMEINSVISDNKKIADIFKTHFTRIADGVLHINEVD